MANMNTLRKQKGPKTKPVPFFYRMDILVILHGLKFSNLLHLLAFKSFILSVFYGGRFFEVLFLLPFPDNTFLFNHSLEAFNRFFQWLCFINFYESYMNHPLSEYSAVLEEPTLKEGRMSIDQPL